jgi:hypothetical protein
MCERHPPERPALVQELEEKIAVRCVFHFVVGCILSHRHHTQRRRRRLHPPISILATTKQQDARLLARLRERVWAERFEGQAYSVDHPKLRRVVQEALRLQHALLASRYRLRDVRDSLLALRRDDIMRWDECSSTNTHFLTHTHAHVTSQPSSHSCTQNLATAAETNLRTMSRGLLHSPTPTPSTATASRPLSPRSPRSSPSSPSSSLRRRSALTASSPEHKQPRSSLSTTATTGGAAPTAAGGGGDAHTTQQQQWGRVLASVYARTGIADLDLFLQKLTNWCVA